MDEVISRFLCVYHVFRNPDFQHRTTVSHSLLTLAGKVGTDRATQSLALFGQLDIAR